MANEGIPPSEPQDPGVEPTEPIEPTEPTEPAEPVEPEPSEPPAQLSPEEIEERAFQRMTSWLGRRDKALLDNMGELIDQRVRKITPEPVSSSPDTVFDNPDQWFQSKYQHMKETETQEQINYNNTMFKTAGNLMDTDPLFADQELGKEVIEEVKKIAPTIDRRTPADVAGNLLVKDALVNVYKKRASAKVNPLGKNTPTKTPLGTITPPAPTPPKGKPLKLSPLATEMAKKWGYKEDDLKKVFREG